MLDVVREYVRDTSPKRQQLLSTEDDVQVLTTEIAVGTTDNALESKVFDVTDGYIVDTNTTNYMTTPGMTPLSNNEPSMFRDDDVGGTTERETDEFEVADAKVDRLESKTAQKESQSQDSQETHTGSHPEIGRLPALQFKDLDVMKKWLSDTIAAGSLIDISTSEFDDISRHGFTVVRDLRHQPESPPPRDSGTDDNNLRVTIACRRLADKATEAETFFADAVWSLNTDPTVTEEQNQDNNNDEEDEKEKVTFVPVPKEIRHRWKDVDTSDTATVLALLELRGTLSSLLGSEFPDSLTSVLKPLLSNSNSSNDSSNFCVVAALYNRRGFGATTTSPQLAKPSAKTMANTTPTQTANTQTAIVSVKRLWCSWILFQEKAKQAELSGHPASETKNGSTKFESKREQRLSAPPALQLLDFSQDSRTIVNKCVLRNVDFELFNKSVTGVLGPVGSGKSTLLLALLKEIAPEGGYVSFERRSDGKPVKIAYMAQQPWITSATVRDNILFGAKFEKKWFVLFVYAFFTAAISTQIAACLLALWVIWLVGGNCASTTLYAGTTRCARLVPC